MTLPALQFSDDQAEAWDRLADVLGAAGVDLVEGTTLPAATGKTTVLAVIGKAGSGKTMLLAELTKALTAAGVDVISGDYEGRRRKDRRTLAILAPTNKAASVLRNRGVPATTIHRILYTPVYDPEYERIAEWLAGNGDRPEVEGLTDSALDRAKAFYEQVKSIPGALAAAGLRGRTSSWAGNGAKTRWTSASSTNPRCWTNASSRTCARSFQRSCSSAIPRSLRRSASPGKWSSTACQRAAS